MRLAFEREMLYAAEFPFIDYGLDLRLMAELERGIKVAKIRRSNVDSNPPENVKKMIEEKLSKLKSKKHDYIPENFVGKGGKGYILKNWTIHRGLGAPKVSKEFEEAVRLTGTRLEH